MNPTDQAAYGNSFFAATKVDAPERGRLTFDLNVDVCVVGGGLAGLTTAREVARRGWSVAVLEANRVASAASGRNCGFVRPGFAERIDRIVERVGLDRAKALWALSEAGAEYVRNTIRESEMPGVEMGKGWLHVSKVDRGDEMLALVQLMGQEFGAAIEGWPTERVRDVLKTPYYFHGVHFPYAFHIHPLNYALGLAAEAERAGARIFEDTPALSIDPAGVRKRIVTPSARVRAAHVVLAGNTALGPLMPRVADTVVPMTSYLITTAPLGERLAAAIAYAGGVSDTEMADNHYRVVGGDRLLWSGRMRTWEANPQRFVRGLRRDIARLFPQLGPVEVEFAWSGTLGRTVHKMPQIGELAPGLWLANGFGGHGLNTTALAGELIARAIVESDNTWRLFLPFELIWAGGSIGRAIAQVGYWKRRLRDHVQGRLARSRDAARLRQAAAEEVADQSRRQTLDAERAPINPAVRSPRIGPGKGRKRQPPRRKGDGGGALDASEPVARSAADVASHDEPKPGTKESADEPV